MSSTRWFAVYTCARHEKAVVSQLQQRSIQTFLPTYSALRCWGRHRTTVELPLFPSYLFVRINVQEWLQVANVPGVVQIVRSQGRPAPMPEGEVEALQNALQVRRSEPHPFFSAGERVRIRRGPLENLEGVVIRQKGHSLMIVSVDFICRSVAIQLEAADLEGMTRARAA